ncbi:MAG: aminopeptidase P family protein [Bacteroidota bacterium]
MRSLRAFWFLPFLLLVSAGDGGKYNYDTDLLTPEFHEGRRNALRALMPDSSVAVFFASPVRNRANDVDYDYHPDPNFYYLTGLREPNAMLLVFKEKIAIDTLFTNEILLVQDRSAGEEAWTGRRLGPAGAKKTLKIDRVLSNKALADLKIDFKRFSKVLFDKLPQDIRDHTYDSGDLYDLVTRFGRRTEGNSNNENQRLEEYMAVLRQIKQPEEMVLLRKAINISCAAHIEMIKALEPGMGEYETQAILEYEFRRRGAESVGYPSICGGGENSCILHYTTNRKPLTGNNLIVLDAGAEYHGYTADITRTLPVDGKFSDEEKAIYNIVLEAQIAGITASRAGNEFRAPHKAAVAVVKKRLLELGIITKEEDFQNYFFHGTSHYLGLDVHDPGLYGRLQPGNVITVEPGIYIPEGSPCDPKWWNIGIRIEDDILITTGDPENLSGGIPKTIPEIEVMMQVESYLNRRPELPQGHQHH